MRTGNVIVMRRRDIMFISLLIHDYSNVLAILYYTVTGNKKRLIGISM